MAFRTTAVSVGNTATLLIRPTTATLVDPVPGIVFNNDTTVDMYIGGQDVTTATGFPIPARTGMAFKLLNSDPVWAIVAAGTVDCRVMIGRQS